MTKIFDLDKKVAIVSGSMDERAKAVACALCACGAAAVIAVSKKDEARSVLEDLTGQGYPAEEIVAVPEEEGAISSLVEEVIARRGRVDILVHIAPVSQEAPIDRITPCDWDRLMKDSAAQAFLWARGVLPSMRGQKRGKIIFVVPVDGKSGFAASGVHTCAAGGAVLSLARQLARQEAGAGIRVNAVACGILEDDKKSGGSRAAEEIAKIPAGRPGRPEEAAGAVLFLASDSADFITGETVDVNGGFYMA